MVAAVLVLHPGPRHVTLAIHESVLSLVRRHGFAVHDALLVASALEAGRTTLLTEDTHDGLVVSGRLMIRNPFAPLRRA